jgi:Flp pilus assembly protein TadD
MAEAAKDRLQPRALYPRARTNAMARTAILAAATLGLALMLGGCQTTSLSDVTGSIGVSDKVPTTDAEWQAYVAELGRRYDAKPGDKTVAMKYAQALRYLGRHAQAVAVLQGLAVKYPKDMAVLAAYGKALVDDGRLQQAAEVLPRAHTPERPDWSVLSAQGSVADQLGDHTQAQEYYAAALKIVPNQPQVLSNLGLSYALSKRLPDAESTLRTAAMQPKADIRVRQNLALVLALEGKFTEAEEVSRRDLAPIEAAGNVMAIREMIAQSNTWRDIQKLNGKSARAGGQTTVPAVAQAQSPAAANPALANLDAR